MRTYSVEQELRALTGLCDAEEAVQGHFMTGLMEEHFASPETQELFTRVMGLARQHHAIPTIKVLQHDPAVSEDARDILATHAECPQDLDDAAAIFDQLELYRKLRVLYEGTRAVVDNLREPTPASIDLALHALEDVALKARSARQDTEIIRSGEGSNAERLVKDLLIQRKPDRIRTGFPAFDEASGGFARKDLVLVAATTGGGKSVMAEQLAINSYLLDNRRTAIVSFEMDADELYSRLLSNITEIPFEKVYLKRLSPAQISRCLTAWKAFNEHGEKNGCSFDIWCPTFDVNADALSKTLKPRGYDMVLVDYVGLVDSDKKLALWESLGEITRSFKLMANEQNCVVVVFAQLDEDTNKVKYSKAMRHHASYVWTWQYGEEEEEKGQVTIDQSKARHCRRFPFDVLPNMSIMQFMPIEGGVAPRDFLGLGCPPGNPVSPVVREVPPDNVIPIQDALTPAQRLARQLNNINSPQDEGDL